MQQVSAAILFIDSFDPNSLSRPLMLQDLLFCPVAFWLSQALMNAGVERFFVACPEPHQEQAKACFPEDAPFASSPAELANLLRGALPGLSGDLLFITRPVFPHPGGKDSPLDPCAEQGVFRAEADSVRKTLEEGGALEEIFTSSKDRSYIVSDAYTLLSSPSVFQRCQDAARRAIVARHCAKGVLFLDPEAAYLDPRVTIGAGTLILPNTILRGKTTIGQNCEIGPNTVITNCTVGDNTVINASQCTDSVIGSHANIGPFGYVRPNCVIGDHVKVGDFVEVKNSTLGEGVKLSHLTYVGDSDIGKKVIMGCGTVTVNYDGKAKYRTVVEDGAFVGCNTNLIAPVRVGQNAYIAAGSTITDDVPEESLAIARSRQVVKPRWVKNRRN